MSPHATLTKISFLVLNSVCAQVVFTAPVPPPHPDEQQKFAHMKGVQERSRFTVLHAATAVKRISHVLNLIEALATIVTAYPYLFDLLSPSLSALLGKALLVPSLAAPASFVSGCMLMYSGTLVRYASYRHLGRFFTFQLAVRKEHKLVTGGPYTLVRHPSYTGLIMYLVGAAVCHLGTGSYWCESGLGWKVGGVLFALVYVGMFVYVGVSAVVRTVEEDAVLRGEFGEQWDVWAAKTPYRLLPYVF